MCLVCLPKCKDFIINKTRNLLGFKQTNIEKKTYLEISPKNKETYYLSNYVKYVFTLCFTLLNNKNKLPCVEVLNKSSLCNIELENA